MFQDKEKLYQVYRALLSMALSWALVLVINQYFELRVAVFLCAFFSFLPALGVFLFELNKKNTITYLILASIIPILVLIFLVRRFNVIEWAREYAHWIATYNGSEELHQASFSNMTIFLICILSVIGLFLLTKTQLLKISLAIVVMVSLILLSIRKINISKVVVAICLFYLMSIILECYGILYARKTGKKEKKESILYLAPICLLLSIIAVAMPSKEEPIQWMVVRNFYESMKDQMERWSSDLDYYFSNQPNEFFISFTGYTEENGRLVNKNNSLIKDDRVAMRFSGGSVRNRAIYLIGSVSDIYTGYNWEKSRTDYLPEEQEYKLDYLELAYALSRQELEILENNRLVENVTLKVKYDNIKTKTFFYPLKTSWFNLLSDSVIPKTEASNITFDKPKGRDIAYEGVFFEMNLGGEEFVKMLKETDSFSYDAEQGVKLDSIKWLEANALRFDKTDSFISGLDIYELFGGRAKLIKEKYTKLPEELPIRVKELAEQVTADYDTTYDKLKAIEAYLQTYTYSLSPANPPEGQNFVDYFLFESKEGYCTSFATAMAVLGRCIGVPMRYVEGFVAKSENRDKNNMYPIKNSQAHAWSEAYFEGVGWIPFEATAPYVSARYTTWIEESKAEVVNEIYPGHYEGEIPEGYVPYNGGFVIPEKEGKKSANEALVGVITTLGAVLIVVVIIMTYYNILKYRHNREYDRSDTSRKMYLLFLKVLEVLKKEGFQMEEQETIRMLARRVKDHYRYDHITFNDVAKIFMRYRYAEELVSEEELGKVIRFRDGLVLKRKEEQPRFKLWLEEFFFLLKVRGM